MAQDYDLIVIGAGPAGLMAAKAAGLAGCKVALLERKADMNRLDRMCGQTLVSVNEYYFDDLVTYNRAGKLIRFLRSGFSFSYDGPVKNCYAWHIYSPDGTCLQFGNPEQTRARGDHGAVGIAYDKEVLFRCLVEEVRGAGVDVRAGHTVQAVTSGADSVQVTTSAGTYEAAYVIAADGTNSRTARLMDFNRERTFYCYLLSKGWYMRRVRPPAHDILISGIWYGPVAPGFMFIFPRPYDDELTVVFLTLDPRVELDAVADYFMCQNPFFAAWFQGAEKVRQHSSAQHVLSPVVNPYRQRVLLAGDAGSCQELENSGAMISGYKAGNAVAAALREERIGTPARALAEYVAWWQQTYIRQCPHEAYLMNFALPYVLDREADLNYICSLAKEPLPPCWNPYAAVAHMGGLMQRLMPSVQQGRPELLPKLGRMAAPMSEILAATTRACQPPAEFE